MTKIIFINSSFIAIRIKRNKGLIFWFHKPYAFTHNKPRKYWIPRCYIDDISILTMSEEESLKYLSESLDEIINKTKNIVTPEQEITLSSYRTLMNKMINYYNLEWKI